MVDQLLEMEVSEEFVHLAPTTNNNNGKEQTSSSASSTAYYARFGRGAVYLVAGFFIGSIITSDMASTLRFWEAGGEPTLAPSPPPTPAPTAVPTVEPTPAPIQTGTPTTKPDDHVDGGAAMYPAQPHTVFPDPPLTPERAEELAKEWGKWEFDKKRTVAAVDYYDAYPHRDVPHDKFPKGAWQTDKDYLQPWLEEALKLVTRAQEAILAEYGFGDKQMSDKPFDDRANLFHSMRILNTSDPRTFPRGRKEPTDAGYITPRAHQGLMRRLLHAIMTEDTFTFVLGGHSAAAGHGNYFRQSYAMQFHKVMEPVLGLLGVSLRSHNFAQGGLGTFQSMLGMRSIYGAEIDMIAWDSGMTEKDAVTTESYLRYALTSGNRVPFLFGGVFGHLKYLDMNADADIGQYGNCLKNIPTCEDEIQAETVPYAARFLKCKGERQDMCNSNKYLGNCWVERPDVIPPVMPQDEHPGSQVGWHPGFRMHQITGRSIAFTVLRALRDGLQKWKEQHDFVLPDDEWHVTAYYENTRTKALNITNANCEDYWNKLDPPIVSSRVCNLALRANTEFSPRANAHVTSIQSLTKPNELGYVPHYETPMLYTGPNVHNPILDLPEGEADVLAIVSNGRTYTKDDYAKRRRHLLAPASAEEPIVPGLGWLLNKDIGRIGHCDGSYNSECGRHPASSCLYPGHNDGRAGFEFNSYSGWVVLTLPQIKDGMIITKMETWRSANANPMTASWTSIDGKRRRKLRNKDDNNNVTVPWTTLQVASDYDETTTTTTQRNLRKKKPPPAICDNFQFQFAINGKVTSWNKEEFEKKNHSPQRVVEIQVLLDDPNFIPSGQPPKDVELAIRMIGCGGGANQRAFQLTHIYYA